MLIEYVASSSESSLLHLPRRRFICDTVFLKRMEIDDAPSGKPAKRPRLGSKTIDMDLDLDLEPSMFTMTSLQSALPTIGTNGGDIVIQQQNPHNLPVDSWAGVMGYLPFPDMLGLSATARYFSREVSPLVRRLAITSWTQMLTSKSVGRFVGIRHISIKCLLEPDDHNEYKLCQNTSDLVVKFLSAFPNLRRAWVGGASPSGDRIAFDPYRFDYHDQIRFAKLVELACEGYRAGQLSQDLHLEGLVDFRRGTSSSSASSMDGFSSTYVCPFYDIFVDTPRPLCPQCFDIARLFPVLHVIKMQRGLECLSFEKRLEILADRGGGREAIVHCAVEAIFDRHKHDPLWIVKVDENGKPIGPGGNNGGGTMHRVDAVHYSAAMFEELQIAKKYGIDMSEYDYAAIEEHLPVDWHASNNLATGGSSRGKLYIAEPTYNALTELGLALTPSDFRRIVRNEETQMFSMGGLLSLEHLQGSIPLVMDTDV